MKIIKGDCIEGKIKTNPECGEEGTGETENVQNCYDKDPLKPFLLEEI